MSENELTALSADFKRYLSRVPLEFQFGRDELYDHQHTLPIVRTEEVRHVHLADPNKPWRAGIKGYRRTSDHHIVYCQGASDEEIYLLIALLSPDAHEQAKNNSIMYNIGIEAEKFRLKY